MGLAKSTPGCAALREAGEMNIEDELALGPIRYWLKLKKSRGGDLWLAALEEVKEGWLKKEEEKLDRVGLGWVIRGNSIGKWRILKIIKNRVFDLGRQELKRNVSSKEISKAYLYVLRKTFW